MLLYLQALAITTRSFVASRMARDEAGTVVEKVILTAIFAALAIAVGGIIVAKVTSSANAISLN